MNAVSSPASAPASGISHVDALPPGTRLAEFEILGLLGVGGFGMVYKAFDHSLHRSVAIKEYMPSSLAGRSEGQSLWVRSSSDQQTFRAGLASFVGEARLLAQFDHPSLVKVFRFWEANNTAYMVMPLYTGMTFKQARAQMRTPPPEVWLRKLLWSVLGALRVLHDGKTLHRDISPDNIFLQDNGPPVLLDLGAARHAINDQDRKHTAVLKVNYAPIEQYSDGDEELRQGPWSDLYSLAAVVHGCLCNDTPLPATLRSIRDRMVSFSRVARTVKRQFGVEYSAPFVAAVAKSLALRPADRPQSIDEFLQIMEMTAAPEGVEHFDFRADLGDIWVEPADRPGPGQVTPTVDVTSASQVIGELPAPALAQRASPVGSVPPSHRSGEPPEMPTAVDDAGGDTVMLGGPDTVAADAGDTVFIDAGDTVAADDSRYDDPDAYRRAAGNGGKSAEEHRGRHADRDAGGRSSARPAKAGGKRVPIVAWLAVAVFSVVAIAGGVRWAQSGKAAPKDDIITEMAEPAAPAPAAEAVLAEAAASTPASDLAASAVQASAAAASAAESAPAVPAFVAASAPARAPRTAKRPVVEPVATPIVVHEEPAPAPPPVVAEPKPRPPPPRVLSPQESCADANFLARPMCIHQECQKASHAAHPICVESRRRYEAEEQRRRQTPN
ncbi:serine/threonine-protein kinase [Acidovorax sp. sic0104]|uniref:serine/threonine protein kinase n=1 Tax=Acidovorax sp. sic0104 TaxID=2854784 RepID=UPI001C44BADF|nr:serine/threonine-protein kinase [Acidovorax sp. sic0104]MBV7541121.1 serine/threonine protein kinase [Acidovorax sp. sic0104]